MKHSPLHLSYIICFLVPISIFFSVLGVFANESGQFSVKEGVVFSSPGRALTLDLFLPENSSNAVPCVLVIQGGGFRPQDGQKFKPFAVYLAEHGFAAALISYRGSPDHQYMETIADTKAAVRFVRKISKKHNIDPNRMGAMGRSAGGTLAALLAVTSGDEWFEGRGGNPEYSSSIQAAVAFSGVFDFVARFTEDQHIALQPNVKTKIVQNGKWVGPPFSPKNKHWLNASAINHVDKNDPAVLFLHCKDDSTVPWLQSQEMHQKMKVAGIESATVYYETGGHGYKDLGEKPMEEMVLFFKKNL